MSLWQPPWTLNAGPFGQPIAGVPREGLIHNLNLFRPSNTPDEMGSRQGALAQKPYIRDVPCFAHIISGPPLGDDEQRMAQKKNYNIYCDGREVDSELIQNGDVAHVDLATNISVDIFITGANDVSDGLSAITKISGYAHSP